MAGKPSSFMAVATEGMAPGERVECLMALGVAGLPDNGGPRQSGNHRFGRFVVNTHIISIHIYPYLYIFKFPNHPNLQV